MTWFEGKGRLPPAPLWCRGVSGLRLGVAPECGPIPQMAPDLLREFDASARAFVDRLVPTARALARLQDEAAARLYLRPTLLADHGLCLGIQLMARLLDESPTTLERDKIEIPSGMATTSPITGRSGDLVHVEARVPLGIELPEATVDLGVMTVAFDGELVAEGYPRGAGRDLWVVPSGQVTARLHQGTTESTMRTSRSASGSLIRRLRTLVCRLAGSLARWVTKAGMPAARSWSRIWLAASSASAAQKSYYLGSVWWARACGCFSSRARSARSSSGVVVELSLASRTGGLRRTAAGNGHGTRRNLAKRRLHDNCFDWFNPDGSTARVGIEPETLPIT